jgi:hypothetical protein
LPAPTPASLGSLRPIQVSFPNQHPIPIELAICLSHSIFPLMLCIDPYTHRIN